jgi:uncharacterized repeat protein (TIGR03803 family)
MKLQMMIPIAILAATTAHAASKTTLHSFNGAGGATPYDRLTAGPRGELSGVTIGGGSSGKGTVFSYNWVSGSFSLRHSFSGLDGDDPHGAVVRDSLGNLYGTTEYGGTSSRGVIYRLAPDNTLSVLHSFGGSEGSNPLGKLYRQADGSLVGTTWVGGTTGTGTIFRLNAGGTLTTLASFGPPNGQQPYGGVIADGTGNFFGTTRFGGTAGEGTVFKLATDNSLTTLASMPGGASVGGPGGDLLFDKAGNLYGTSISGGAFNYGFVFKLAPDGTLTNLHSFAGADGSYPYSTLIMDTRGNLFGTTGAGFGGGTSGTVFRIGADGAFTNLYTFTGGLDGSVVGEGLVADFKGRLYGITLAGGGFGAGTIFRIDDAGYVVPEPSTWMMLIAGFGLVGGMSRQRRRRETRLNASA